MIALPENSPAELCLSFQVSLQIDLTHLQEFDPELAEAVVSNARRYNLLASDAVWELIPDYRERDNVPPRDALDVYIQHRNVMEDRVTQSQGGTGGQGGQPQGQGQQQRRNVFPPELMRRYEVTKDTSKLHLQPYRVTKVGGYNYQGTS